MKSLALFISTLFCAALFAADYTPPKITETPRIDGVLDESIWQHALIVEDFLQRYPTEGAMPTERTAILIIYSPTALYLGFRAYDNKPERIVATVMKRDDFDLVQNDQFAFAIDSYNDGRNGYWFSTNPLGARVDAQFGNEGDIWQPDWNGIWDCKTHMDQTGWTAEIEIPFSTLRFRKNEEVIMGMNFFRRIIRTNEQVFAPLIPLQLSNGTPNVSAARKYHFHGIHAADHLFAKPYALSGFETETGGTEGTANGGIDLRYQLTNSLVSNFAVNMDFAEAEVDDRQINLTRFKLFFPEKREFFLENAANFLFGIPGETELFFSRRIGLTEDSAESVPNLFGAKLTGRIGNTDVGILNVQTRSASFCSNTSDSCVETSAENFGVLRFKSAIASRSYIGGILTNRSAFGGTARQAFGSDLSFHLGSEVFLNAFAAATNSTQNRTALDSSASSIGIARGGERASFAFRYTDVGTSFEPPIGFVQRPDTKQIVSQLFLPFYQKQRALLSITPGYLLIREQDHHGTLTLLQQEASLKLTFTNEDQIRFFLNSKREHVPELFPIFRTVQIESGDYEDNRAGFDLSTKAGRPLSGLLTLSAGQFFGGRRFELSPTAVWKINPHLTFSETLGFNRVRLDSTRFNILLTQTRMSYSLNTSLSTAAILQYDNSSQQFGVNFRAGYLFKEGTELFVVYNEIMERDPLSLSAQRNERSFLVKFTYLLRI